MQTIPSLSLRDFTHGTPEERAAFVQNLGNAYQDIGFVAVRDHYLNDALQDDLYRVVKAFFALPEDVKLKYEVPGLAGQRGYTGKGKEHAKGRNVGDLKEFYHVGQTIQNDPERAKRYPTNVFPLEVADFERVTTEVYRRLEDTGRAMLQAIALYLGLDEHYFDDKIFNGDSILRPIHYFPIEDPNAVPEGAVRAAEHEDINLITLLMGASADGLQVLTRAGQWVPVTAVPQSLVINVGDMLQRLTNNRLRSTTHRVVNPPRELMHTSRFSVPFFLHPRAEMDLTCLPSCVTAANPLAYTPITAGEYLDERLREIGLKK